ncbi:MAG: DUF2786 domain-containing protein [Actinobacteria bacterium]|nr:DUF2786 domain-containing protein [Actinomycetota bacterium]
MNDDKLDLITKLLAKAESTTPEEAEALTEHAERLMLKYGIERARIEEQRSHDGDGYEKVVTEKMLFTGAYARDLRELGAGIAHALGAVRPLYGAPSARDSALPLYLVGCASDVKQAQLLTMSLQVQALVAMRSWWAADRDRYRWSSESDRRRARSGFLRGFGVGAAERIRESRRVIVEESGSGTALVLASRRARVDDAVAAMTTRRTRARDGADAGSFSRGRRSGLQANTGERAVAR